MSKELQTTSEKLYGVDKLYNEGEKYGVTTPERLRVGWFYKKVNGQPVLKWFREYYGEYSFHLVWAPYCRFADFLLLSANKWFCGLCISVNKDKRATMRRLRDDGYLYARVKTMEELKEVIVAYMEDDFDKLDEIKEKNIPEVDNASRYYAEEYWKLMGQKEVLDLKKEVERSKKFDKNYSDNQDVAKIE